MSWSNDEIEKIRRQHQLKQQQEEAQKAQNNQTYKAERAAQEREVQRGRVQAAQLLEPLIDSLQIRRLMEDVDKRWGIPEPYHPPKKSLNEEFYPRWQPSQAYQLAEACYSTTITRYHPGSRSTQSGMGGSNLGSPGSPSSVERITVDLCYLVTEQRYKISFHSRRAGEWEEICTP